MFGPAAWPDQSLRSTWPRLGSGQDATALGHASVLHAKNNVHDMPHITEMLRVEVVGDLDVFVVCPGDLEGEACGCELNKSQAEVASIGILIVGLDVTDAAVFVLELTLNDKIWVISPDRSKSSSLGASLSNETSKYSSPASPTDT